MNKIRLVASREYLKVVRKPTFWIATLFFPVFMIVVSMISGYSAVEAEKKIEKETAASQLIYIVDPSGVIDQQYTQSPFEKITDTDLGIADVKSGKADAAFVYPADILTNRHIEVYAKSKGLLSDTGYPTLATNILKQSILNGLGDQQRIDAYSAMYDTKSTVYKNGEVVDQGIEQFIVPGAVLFAYFIMITFAVGWLLMSVSEEKENRMIETILSMVRPRDLIWGKILGQVAIVFTQFAILIGFAAVGFAALKLKLPIPIDLSAIKFDAVQVITGIWYLLCGFLIMANTMVGVGSIMPNYKDASSFSSVFIILAIFPIYFFSLLLSDPSGLIAVITSYFPYSAAMVLLLRSALNALPLWESVLSSIVLGAYVVISFFLAYKLFEIGSLEYRSKISLRQILGRGK